MFYLNYDLARQIAADRRAEAAAIAMRRSVERENRRARRQATAEAEVIEVAFASSCEQERIGA